MADLGAVLRKTIDGLPNATPSLRAKVYDKARAAIQRQIDSADPPLPPEMASARSAALEDAIDRTEAHYIERDAEAEAAFATPEAPAELRAPQPSAASPARPLPATEARPAMPAPQQPAAVRPAPPKLPAATFAPTPADPHAGRAPLPPPQRRAEAPPPFPAQAEEPDEMARPAPVQAPFVPPAGGSTARRMPDMAERGDARLPRDADPRSAGGRPPAQEPGVPLFPTARAKPARSRRPLIAAAVLVALLGGAAALAWTYRDDIDTLVAGLGGTSSGAGTGTAATPAATGTPAAGEAPAAAGAAPPQTPATQSTRQFTQRLQPDGSEVDEGPGAVAANAFDEGTQVSEASPPEASGESVDPDAATTLESTIGQDPAVVGAQTPVAGAAAGDPGALTAAAAPPAPGAPAAAGQPDGAAVPVGQRAVFYEERSDTEPGTQRTGGVVWSVINEAGADGQAGEPAIRAVATVPDENLTLTLTIRRNADPTLPASHVVELMFDTPADFDGGSIANVQRLALKPTEQARGEPLIGVAGKISDGFFIIALNNIDQAVQNNLSLLGSEQWIDIPLAYETGRRALISIEKGIPGERVFKEAMDAWAAKTADASSAG